MFHCELSRLWTFIKIYVALEFKTNTFDILRSIGTHFVLRIYLHHKAFSGFVSFDRICIVIVSYAILLVQFKQWTTNFF